MDVSADQIQQGDSRFTRDHNSVVTFDYYVKLKFSSSNLV